MIPRSLFITIAIMLVLVIALGFYFRRMQQQAYLLEPAATAALAVTPPASGPTENVTLYVADDAANDLHPQSTKIPLPAGRQQRAEELLRALLRIYQQPGAPHPLAEASDIRSIYLVDPGVAVIDLNAAFADQHRSGIMVEQLTVNSLVETLAANVPGIQSVSILIEGKPRDTLAGHVDLTQFFDVSTVWQEVSGQ